MEQILQFLSLGSLLENFQGQRMEPQTVLDASDQELIRLGVCTIGDRIRLRDACKKKINEETPSTSHASAARVERLSIFNPRRHNSRTQARVAARSTTTSASGSKRKTSAWTPTFVCLADCAASKTPSSVEKEILFSAGLGVKKIKLDLQDDEQTVLNRITSDEKDADGNLLAFPQLKTCGVFEMMRCSANCRDLFLINCAWNAKDLRSNMGGGQGKIYLRPIQKSLSTKSILSDSRSEVKEVCQMCNQEILVRKLRDHLWSCREGLETSDKGEGQGDEGEGGGNGTIMLTPGSSSNSSTSTSVQPSLELEASATTNLDPHPLPAASLLNTATTTPIANVQVSNQLAAATSSGPPQSAQANTSTAPSPPSTTYIDLTRPTEVTTQHGEQLSTVDNVVSETINYCQQHNVSTAVEILRCFQSKIVTGRLLEIQFDYEANESETNFIMVDRQNLLTTALDEIMSLEEYRKTLQVQFYGEVSVCSTMVI